MMEFAIHLEVCDPERNIWRSYSITGGQDLFGRLDRRHELWTDRRARPDKNHPAA